MLRLGALEDPSLVRRERVNNLKSESKLPWFRKDIHKFFVTLFKGRIWIPSYSSVPRMNGREGRHATSETKS